MTSNTWPLEEFLDGDGNPGADRQRPGNSDEECAAAVAAAWLKQTSRIPATFAVACALHESTYTLNERDTESSGKQTGGIFQITLGGTKVDIFGDAWAVGAPEKSAYLLDDACFIHASKSERDMDACMKAAGLTPGTDDATFIARGGLGYLTVAHNQGRGNAVKTIKAYNLDWSGAGGYAERNANTINTRDDGTTSFNGPGAVRYGNDAITGGKDWADYMGAPQVASSDGGGGDAGGDAGASGPTIDASTSTLIRFSVVGLVALLIAYWAITRGPLKGTV